jgi:hypothetical protein
MSGPVDTVLDETTPVGRVVLRSVVTLARVVPFDVHSLVLAEVWPGRGFHEASYSLLQRRWVHVRTVESVDDRRCIVRDRLEFEPRVLSAITERIVRAVFARRHARLQAKFAS